MRIVINNTHKSSITLRCFHHRDVQNNVFPLDVTVKNELINSDRLHSAETSTASCESTGQINHTLKLQYCDFELLYAYYMNLGNNLGAAPSPGGSVYIVGV